MNDEVQIAVDRVWSEYEHLLTDQVSDLLDKSLPKVLNVDEKSDDLGMVVTGPPSRTSAIAVPHQGLSVEAWKLVPNFLELHERRWALALTPDDLSAAPGKRPAKLVGAVSHDLLGSVIWGTLTAGIRTLSWADAEKAASHARDADPTSPLVLLTTDRIKDALKRAPKISAKLQPVEVVTCAKLPQAVAGVTAFLVAGPMPASLHVRLRPTLSWRRLGNGAELVVTERSMVERAGDAHAVAFTGEPPQG